MFRLIRGIFQWVNNVLVRMGLRVQKAADDQFTKDAQGIGHAFDLEIDEQAGEYQEFFDAVAQAEAEYVRQEKELEGLQVNKEQTQLALDGALSAIEKALVAGDKKSEQEARQDAEDFQKEMDDLIAQETRLNKEIDDGEEERAQLQRDLVRMKESLEKLPKEKAKAVAKFLAKTKLIEARERVMGIRKRMQERRPIDTVRDHLDQLDAKERVSAQMSGVATENRREKYIKAGAEATAENKIDALLKARKAEREGKTGEAPVANTEERPKI